MDPAIATDNRLHRNNSKPTKNVDNGNIPTKLLGKETVIIVVSYSVLFIAGGFAK